MRLPNLVKSQKQAREFIEQLFPRPLGYDEHWRWETPYESTHAIVLERMKQVENMEELLMWLMTKPKIYKVAQRVLSRTAATRLQENISFLDRAFSSAYHRERGPSFLQRLRDAAA